MMTVVAIIMLIMIWSFSSVQHPYASSIPSITVLIISWSLSYDNDDDNLIWSDMTVKRGPVN